MDNASVNAMNEIKNAEDKEFFRVQLLPQRPGCMVGVDANL